MCSPLHCSVFNHGPPWHPPSGGSEMVTAKHTQELPSPNLLFPAVQSRTLLGNCPVVLHLAKCSLVLKKMYFNKPNTQTTTSLHKLYKAVLFSAYKLGHDRSKHGIE